MPVMARTLYVPHGIVFIEDPTFNDVEIPEYVDGFTTAATGSCVSVSVMRQCEDEQVTFKLSDKFSVIGISFKKTFNGFIETPGKKIAIYTSGDEIILEKDVKVEKTQVAVWVDDVKFPGVVMVEVK